MTDFDPKTAAQTAIALTTAIRANDEAFVRMSLDELSPPELRGVIWGLLGTTKHLMNYIAEDVGEDDLNEAWQQAAAEIAAIT